MSKKLAQPDPRSVLPPSDFNPDDSLRTDGSYESVWDALVDDLGDRERMEVLSDLMTIAINHIKTMGWTRVKAARMMGVEPPRITELMRGGINRFTIDDLVTMVGKAGLRLKVGLKPPKAEP